MSSELAPPSGAKETGLEHVPTDELLVMKKTLEGEIVEVDSWDTADAPDEFFAYVPEEAKGPDGMKSLRKLPLASKSKKDLDAVIIRNALTRFSQTDLPTGERNNVLLKICRAARKFEIDSELCKGVSEATEKRTPIPPAEPKKEEEPLSEAKGKGIVVEGYPAEGPIDYRDVVSKRMKLTGGLTRADLRRFALKEGRLFEAAYDATAAGSAIPEIWANDVARLREEKVVLSQVVKWYPDLKGKPGDTLHLPRISVITYAAGSPGSGATAQAPTTDSVPCIITERIAEVDINRDVAEDAVPSLIDSINERLATAYEYDFDAQVLAILNNPAAAVAGTLTEAGAMKGTVIAKACGSMRAGTYEPAFLIIHPVQEASLMQDSQFTNAATYGDNSIIKSGRVWDYLGVKIVVSPLVSATGGTYRAYLLAREAVAFAGKRDFNIETDYDVQKRQTIIVASGRYGGTILHDKGVFEIKTLNG